MLVNHCLIHFFKDFDKPEMKFPLRYPANLFSFASRVKETFSDETK